jgi:hypothetical protein
MVLAGATLLKAAEMTFQGFLSLVCVACLIVITLAVMHIAWGVIG